MNQTPLPTRIFIAWNWVVTTVVILLAPIGAAAADIAILRWLFLAPGMEKSALHTASWLAAMWFIGAQALAAIVGFAIGAVTIVRLTAAMRPRKRREKTVGPDGSVRADLGRTARGRQPQD